MYQFHGWATIHETPCNVDEGNLNKIFETLQNHIKKLDWISGLIGLKWINGIPMFYVAGLTNHKRQDSDDVFETYNLIAKNAPGSYGILYIWDDEDKNGYENEFRVFVLNHGKFEEKKDPFLSPCIPTIEDPCSAEDDYLG